MSYLLVVCPDCDEMGYNGVLYCGDCELPCEHDRMCQKCRGQGMVIEQETGLFGRLLVAEKIAYRTRAEAWSHIDEYREGNRA